MADWLQALTLGLLQGLTEFLPISSSAHLRIFPELLGWEDPGAAFTAVVQIGTEVAVLLFFRRDIWRIASAWARSLVRPELRGRRDALLGWYIILGTVPMMISQPMRASGSPRRRPASEASQAVMIRQMSRRK